MEYKKEDYQLLLDINNKKFYGLRHDYFDEKPVKEIVKEAMEEKKEVEIEIPAVNEIIKKAVDVKPPTEEELAEIEKEKKKAELKAQLEALG